MLLLPVIAGTLRLVTVSVALPLFAAIDTFAARSGRRTIDIANRD